MNGYNKYTKEFVEDTFNEIQFLGYLYHYPTLMKQIRIPVECITDGLNRFVYDCFAENWEEFQTISATTIAGKISTKQNSKYKVSDFTNILCDINDFADACIIDKQLDTKVINDFNAIQDLLYEKYENNRLKEKTDEFYQSKISINDLMSEIRTTQERLSISNNEYLDVDKIKELVQTENKTILFTQEYLSKLKIQQHDLIVISARTGVGKSGFALNLLNDLSKNYKCLYFNLEMSESSIFKRLISIESRVPMNMLSEPVTDYQASVVESTIEKLGKRKIKIITRSQTIQSIKRTIIEEQKEEHLMVFIDYVGLIGSTEKYKSLYELVTAITKELRQISLDFDCTIFLLAQINRSGNENPEMKDLKESGELEQSATQVLILSGGQSKEDEQEIILNLAKNREGKTGKIKLIYNKANQTFRLPNYY